MTLALLRGLKRVEDLLSFACMRVFLRQRVHFVVGFFDDKKIFNELNMKELRLYGRGREIDD